MPSDSDEDTSYLSTATEGIKMVADYSGLNFNEAIELDCYTFKQLLKDAFVYKMRQTKDGRDYLENCWILTQTEPDREALRNNFKENKK